MIDDLIDKILSMSILSIKSNIVHKAQTVKWNKKNVKKLLTQAAELALGYYEKISSRLKADGSLVTDADIALENFFAERLDNPEQGEYLIGEESVERKSEEYIKAALKGKTWIVDPIDGTAPFAHHIPTWGILLAYMENGNIKEGAICLPCMGELIMTEKGKVFYSEVLADGNYSELKQFDRISSPALESGLISVSQNIAKEASVSFRNPLQAVCCSAFSGASIARGRYLAYIGTTKLWDIAAVLPVLWNLGFRSRLLNGTEIIPGKTISSIFNTDKSAKSRWALKDQIVLYRDEITFEYICKKISWLK